MLKKESKKTNCHSGLDPESSARAHNTKAYHASGCPIGSGMTGERGRSMIEMLGVLAIIGVLSVGGIAGYTSAMNKHRANELLNQVSMRAASVMAQVEFGNTPNVDDFGTYDGYKFTAATNSANANQFTITISEKTVLEAVCNNMKNAVGSSTPIRNINADCTIITYNNDMGTTVYNSDYNGDPDHCPGKYCTGSNTCVDTGADCTCSGTTPTCKVCNTATGSYTNAADNTPCVTAGNEDGTCQSGTCEATPAGYENVVCDDYQTNAQCGGVGSGWYCKFDDFNMDCTVDSGKCTEITGGDDSSGHWVGPQTDWWSANSWCIGKGSTGLISYATLQSEYGCNKYSGCDWTALSGDGLTAEYYTLELEGSSPWVVNFPDRDFDFAYSMCGVQRALCE